ncbi:MAG TPA: AarF/ABC1/UbiB kinase family protein, partial [Protaetiibacter sp.]|nr:AarF/ABC1/UbiB kinase family protein [Protaetiibacter sp.]
DELVTRIDRGQLAVRVPGVERRIGAIERMLGRLIWAIVFAALLFSGVLLRRDGDEVLAWVLIAASAVPLLWLVLSARRR